MSEGTYDELQKKIAELRAQADAILRKEQDEAIAQVKALIAKFGLTPAQCGFSSRITKVAAPKQAIRAGVYRNPNTGEAVTIRIGKRPGWLTSMTPEELAQARIS